MVVVVVGPPYIELFTDEVFMSASMDISSELFLIETFVVVVCKLLNIVD